MLLQLTIESPENNSTFILRLSVPANETLEMDQEMVRDSSIFDCYRWRHQIQ